MIDILTYRNRAMRDITGQLCSIIWLTKGQEGCHTFEHVHCVGLFLSTRVDRMSEVDKGSCRNSLIIRA
jgi:hypothetical protein